MNIKTFFLNFAMLALSLGQLVLAKMEILVDEDVQNCTAPGQRAGSMDFSKFELIAESETEMFANGSVAFLKPVKAPFKLYAYAERFIRGQWVLAGYERKITDFCEVMHDEEETYYKFFNPCPFCPFEAGVGFKIAIKSFKLKSIFRRDAYSTW